MEERRMDKWRRMVKETYGKILKWIIRKAVHRLDALQQFAFLAYSWGVDEVTDYHVIAERSYPDHHIFGTQVTRYSKSSEESPCTGCMRDCTMCGFRYEKEWDYPT